MVRVLFAGADADVCELMAVTLARAGHRVTTVGDGAAALAAARAESPDVAVLDATMPAMSGLDVCRRLRADPATATLPVIVLTAHNAPRRGRHRRIPGADACLDAPFSPRELLHRIQAVLAGVES